MTDEIEIKAFPPGYSSVLLATHELGFAMASDVKTCALLRTLAATKSGGNILELGTGTGLATAWILDGLSRQATFVTIDNDEKCVAIARENFRHDPRVQIELTDGEAWIKGNVDSKFDLIFADTWHGKYLLLDEVLAMLKPSGIYVIDDMIPQSNWPEGHQQKVDNLLSTLDQRDDLVVTRQQWASGIVIAVKKD